MYAFLRSLIPLAACLALASLATAEDGGLDVHEDYYRGFAQGAYYGLMLAGEDYHVAWCMKAELEYEAKGMGTGADFQRTMEALLEKCREESNAGIHAEPSA
ncbi:MAG: hypothetical protein ACE5KS_09270 [Woeseiaceae bacterium]